MKIRCLVGLICFAMAAAAAPQATSNNDSIEKMAMARLGDDVIVAMIQNQAGHYDLTPDTLIAMKREGISDKVLAALAARGSTTAPVSATALTTAAPATAAASPAVVPDSYEDLISASTESLGKLGSRSLANK